MGLSGGGTGVVSLSAHQSDLQKGFIGKPHEPGETPPSPSNRKKSSNQQSVPIGRALPLTQHRPAYSSCSKKSSTASGLNDLTTDSWDTDIGEQRHLLGYNCSHFWIRNVFTWLTSKHNQRVNMLLDFFGTKCDSSLPAASNKMFGD